MIAVPPRRAEPPSEALERKTVTLSEAAAMLGIARSTAFQLAAENRFPLPLIRLGRRIVVSRAALERLIDPIDPESGR